MLLYKPWNDTVYIHGPVTSSMNRMYLYSDLHNIVTYRLCVLLYSHNVCRDISRTSVIHFSRKSCKMGIQKRSSSKYTCGANTALRVQVTRWLRTHPHSIRALSQHHYVRKAMRVPKHVHHFATWINYGFSSTYAKNDNDKINRVQSITHTIEMP
jgi:hypothetical protein